MINNKIDKTLDIIDLDPKFLFSILKKYLIHLIFFCDIDYIDSFYFFTKLGKKI